MYVKSPVLSNCGLIMHLSYVKFRFARCDQEVCIVAPLCGDICFLLQNCTTCTNLHPFLSTVQILTSSAHFLLTCGLLIDVALEVVLLTRRLFSYFKEKIDNLILKQRKSKSNQLYFATSENEVHSKVDSLTKQKIYYFFFSSVELTLKATIS